MSEYVIVTDSSCDLNQQMVEEIGVEVLPLTFTIRGTTLKNYPDDRDMGAHEFYQLMSEDEMVTTAAVNEHQYEEFLTPVLESGRDALILAFSSGLSATCQSARLAAGELAERFPERKILVVDTLCASLGQGLLVWYAAEKQKAGASIEEVRDWCEANKLHICHWFTVNDLHYLKRGGRISAATAVVGTMLQIKPVLHMDNEGHLVNVSKARGRKASLDAMVKQVGERGIDPAGQERMLISHSACEEDARYIADQIRAQYGVKEVLLNRIGPVIGAHTGPGCVALFFIGTER